MRVNVESMWMLVVWQCIVIKMWNKNVINKISLPNLDLFFFSTEYIPYYMFTRSPEGTAEKKSTNLPGHIAETGLDQSWWTGEMGN